jgi:hypothetical protein
MKPGDRKINDVTPETEKAPVTVVAMDVPAEPGDGLDELLVRQLAPWARAGGLKLTGGGGWSAVVPGQLPGARLHGSSWNPIEISSPSAPVPGLPDQQELRRPGLIEGVDDRGADPDQPKPTLALGKELVGPDQHVEQPMVTTDHPGQIHDQAHGAGIDQQLQLPTQLRQPRIVELPGHRQQIHLPGTDRHLR